MEELVEDHKNELSTKELEQLQGQQQQKVIVEEMSSEEVVGRDDVLSSAKFVQNEVRYKVL